MAKILETTIYQMKIVQDNMIPINMKDKDQYNLQNNRPTW